MSYSEIGMRITALREMNRCTRAELARRADITSKFLYEIEKGRHGFSVKTLASVSQTLGVSSDYILFGKECVCMLPEDTKVLTRFSEEQCALLTQILHEIIELCAGDE